MINKLKNVNLKSLAFYVVSIVSVVVLFKVVTAYGETSITASLPMSGRYLLKDPNLNKCLKSDRTILSIQQSGIYLFASLLPANLDIKEITSAESKPSFSGKLVNQNFSLDGKISCAEAVNSMGITEGTNSVRIVAEFVKKDITGEITFSSSPASKFTATFDKSLQPKKEENKH